MWKKVAVLTVCLCFLLTATVLAKPIITADKTYFDVTTGLYNLEGNVYIEAGNRIITAGQAKVSLTTFEVWGTGKVSLKQDDIHFTGESVHVSGLKKEAEIEGAQFERTGLAIRSDQAKFNWQTKIAAFSGHVEVTQNNETKNYNMIQYNIETNQLIL